MTGATETFDPAAIDILDPELYSGDPYPTYDWLVANAPVFRDEANRLWVVSGYEDLSWVERNPEIFCSAKGVRPDAPGGISIITMDAPEHTFHRRLVNKGFTPKMVRGIADHIDEITSDVLDRVAGAGECDFVADISYRIPLIVICELLGLPVQDWQLLGGWSDALVGAQSARTPDDPAFHAATKAFLEYTEYLQGVFAAKRAEPGDDLVSVLIKAVDDGVLATGDGVEIRDMVAEAERANQVTMAVLSEMGQDELVMFLILLLVAGNETTRNAMSGGVEAFSQEPEQWARLVADPDLVEPAVEEVLRWTSPVLNFSRTATCDTELRGHPIAENDKVLVLYGAANRDPAVFEEPATFRIDRTPNNHLAFGIGPHFCLGANLARLELQILFRQLVRRFPDLHVAAGAAAKRMPNTLVRTIDELPVVFTPAPAG